MPRFAARRCFDVIELRAALKAALGASFNVTHASPATGNPVTVPVSVVDAGRDDETPLPAVFLHSEFGSADPSNIGGRGAANAAMIDLHIMAVDDADWDGAQLVVDIHRKVRDLVRAAEKTLGAAFFAIAASYRDLPPIHDEGGYVTYTRIVTVRATNVEAY